MYNKKIAPKNLITACLVIYNAEKFIERCLESVNNIVDEIVIVMDGQSQDQTYEICKKYTDNIFIQNHIGMSDPHLVFALKKARGDWLLKIDADEFLSAELKRNIKKLVLDKQIDGYKFLCRLYDGQKYITKNKPYKLALFRKNKIGYLGIPHGKFKVRGKIIDKNFLLEHRPDYNKWTMKMFKTKQIPWAKIHARWLLKDFNDLPRFQIDDREWDWQNKLRRRFCFLFPFFGIFKFFHNAIRGEWWNVQALKISFFNGLYEGFLDYFILKFKISSESYE